MTLEPTKLECAPHSPPSMSPKALVLDSASGTHPNICTRTLDLATIEGLLRTYTMCARRWALEPAVCRAIRFAEVQLSDNINQVGQWLRRKRGSVSNVVETVNLPFNFSSSCPRPTCACWNSSTTGRGRMHSLNEWERVWLLERGR